MIAFNDSNPSPLRITAQERDGKPMIMLAINGAHVYAYLTFDEIDRLVAVRDEYLRETRHRGHGITSGE